MVLFVLHTMSSPDALLFKLTESHRIPVRLGEIDISGKEEEEEKMPPPPLPVKKDTGPILQAPRPCKMVQHAEEVQISSEIILTSFSVRDSGLLYGAMWQECADCIQFSHMTELVCTWSW